jgi:hypothetical protein
MREVREREYKVGRPPQLGVTGSDEIKGKIVL